VDPYFKAEDIPPSVKNEDRILKLLTKTSRREVPKRTSLPVPVFPIAKTKTLTEARVAWMEELNAQIERDSEYLYDKEFNLINNH
jgi:hypothetical protein